MQFISDFVDQAVALPMAVLGFLLLVALGWWRGAVYWAGTVLVSFGIILVLKLALAACTRGPGTAFIYTPSGHTMAAAVIYGGLIGLLGSSGVVGAVMAPMAAVLVAVSRLALHAHTVPEVLVGGAVGCLSVWIMLLSVGDMPLSARRSRWRFGGLLLLLLPIFFLHGDKLKVESLLHRLAVSYLRNLLHCP